MSGASSLIAALSGSPKVRLLVSTILVISTLAVAFFTVPAERTEEALPVVAFYIALVSAGNIAMKSSVPWLRRLFGWACVAAALICTAQGIDYGMQGIWSLALAWFAPVIVFGWHFAESTSRQ